MQSISSLKALLRVKDEGQNPSPKPCFAAQFVHNPHDIRQLGDTWMHPPQVTHASV